MPTNQEVKDTLAKVSTATITTILLKKGLRNVWMRGTRPRVRYDLLMAFGWKFLLPVGPLNVLATSFIVSWATA